jgi:hypothetical protein
LFVNLVYWIAYLPCWYLHVESDSPILILGCIKFESITLWNQISESCLWISFGPSIACLLVESHSFVLADGLLAGSSHDAIIQGQNSHSVIQQMQIVRKWSDLHAVCFWMRLSLPLLFVSSSGKHYPWILSVKQRWTSTLMCGGNAGSCSTKHRGIKNYHRQRQKDQDIWMEILKWLFCSCSICGIRESKVMTQRPEILSAKVSTWVGFHWDT